LIEIYYYNKVTWTKRFWKSPLQTLSETILTWRIEMVHPFASELTVTFIIPILSAYDVAGWNSGLTRITRSSARTFIWNAVFLPRIEKARMWKRVGRVDVGRGRNSLKSQMTTRSEGVIEEGIIKPTDPSNKSN